MFIGLFVGYIISCYSVGELDNSNFIDYIEYITYDSRGLNGDFNNNGIDGIIDVYKYAVDNKIHEHILIDNKDNLKGCD